MSVLELKSEIIEMLDYLHTEEALSKILESTREAVEEEDLWALLSVEQIDRLKASIERSKHKENLLSHEDVKKTHAQFPTEITIVQQRLHNKYVVNGTWDKMDEEAREDATHAEIMLYAKEQPDYYLYTVEQTKAHREKLRQQLTAKIANHANH